MACNLSYLWNGNRVANDDSKSAVQRTNTNRFTCYDWEHCLILISYTAQYKQLLSPPYQKPFFKTSTVTEGVTSVFIYICNDLLQKMGKNS